MQEFERTVAGVGLQEVIVLESAFGNPPRPHQDIVTLKSRDSMCQQHTTGFESRSKRES